MSSKPKGHSKDDSLTVTDARRLLAAAKTPRERWLLRLTLDWGLRAEEAGHACLHWLDGQGGTLRIPRQCTCEACRSTGRPFRSKTEAGARVLPLKRDAAMWECAKVYFETYPTVDKQQVSRQAVHLTIRTIANRAGLLDRRVYPHALRATAATRFASMGANEAALCGLMGWNDLRSAQPYIRAGGVAADKFLAGASMDW